MKLTSMLIIGKPCPLGASPLPLLTRQQKSALCIQKETESLCLLCLSLIRACLQVRGSQVEAAALAVAGAVENNRCPMTNITWVIDGKQLQQQFKFKTAVLNDFEAVGYGIPALEPKDLVALNDVPPLPMAPMVVMGPGEPRGLAFV
jgi:glucokinase